MTTTTSPRPTVRLMSCRTCNSPKYLLTSRSSINGSTAMRCPTHFSAVSRSAQTIQPERDFAPDTHKWGIRRVYLACDGLGVSSAWPQFSADSAYTCESSGLPVMAQSSPAATTSISRPDASRTTGCPLGQMSQAAPRDGAHDDGAEVEPGVVAQPGQLLGVVAPARRQLVERRQRGRGVVEFESALPRPGTQQFAFGEQLGDALGSALDGGRERAPRRTALTLTPVVQERDVHTTQGPIPARFRTTGRADPAGDRADDHPGQPPPTPDRRWHGAGRNRCPSGGEHECSKLCFRPVLAGRPGRRRDRRQLRDRAGRHRGARPGRGACGRGGAPGE